jgi:pimeloyl-ACP methyl ester carboxylesterase
MTVHSNIANLFSAPVVALHSSASSSLQWDRLADELAGRFAVSAPDLPGYGIYALSAEPSGRGMAAIADPVIEHIAEHGQPVHLVGHSFGAAVALKIALMRPDLVKSLTLYEPATFHFLKFGDQRDEALFADIDAISDAVTTGTNGGNPEEGMQTFIDFWNGQGTWDSTPEHRHHKLAAMARSIMSDFANQFAETWTLDDLSRLTMPTLVMMGMDSPEIAQHVTTQITNAIPQARLAMLPGLGHMAPVFEPDWVNPRIYEHIASVERPTAGCYWPHRTAA